MNIVNCSLQTQRMYKIVYELSSESSATKLYPLLYGLNYIIHLMNFIS